MKCPQSIQINIPNPCSQNWDKMTPSGNGRHCAHCSTAVIDFTTWTDAELYQFFAKGNEHVCGRYLSTQLNRPINILPQPHSRLYRMVVAMGLTLIFGGVVEAKVQSKVLVQQNDTVKKAVHTEDLKTGVMGTVADSAKEPVVNALIIACLNGREMGSTITNIDGQYSMQLTPGQYELTISYLGLATQIKSVVVADHMVSADFTMDRDKNAIVLGGPIVRIVDRRTFNRNLRAIKRGERKARRRMSDDE